MAQIGTFARAEDGSYTGAIKTLSLTSRHAFFRPSPPRTRIRPTCA